MNIRKVSYDILIECMMHHGYANLLMRKQLNMFSNEEKRFATHLIYGVLRSFEALSHQVKPYIKKSCGKRNEILLAMGVYQLFYMNVPDYSAINETVELAKPQEKQFINAILRKVADVGQLDFDGLSEFEKERLCASIPLFIANMWKKQYGESVTIQLMKAFCKESEVFGRFNTLKINPSLINDDNILKLDDIGFKYKGLLQESNYYHLGQAVIQDYHSQQIVKLLDLKDGDIVLDGCAAPGSKTSQIAMMLHNSGTIDAVELHSHRAQLLIENCQRLGINNVNVINASLLDVDLTNEYYDAILLDAPCSGLGVLARRAEIRYHIDGKDLDQLQQLQLQLLDKVASSLKVGGQLLYSTCTLNKKENEKQVEGFLKRHLDYQLIKEVTMLPDAVDNDSFYAALMVKR